MTTKTFYPRTVTQTTGGKYAKFNDLNVIKATNNGYAQTVLIKSKKNSPNRPSTVTCTDFNMQLPLGCIVTKITVEYKHMKVSSSGKYNNIPAPTVSLLYNDKVITAIAKGGSLEEKISLSKKSKAPLTAPDEPQPAWNGKYKLTYYDATTSTTTGVLTGKTTTTGKKTVNCTYTMPNRNVLNNTSFGVRINYPTNTNTNPGYLRLYWVRVKVEYTESSYTLSTKQTYGGTNHDGSLNTNGGYNKDEYRLKATINRKSKTSYIPKVTITTPRGFTFKDYNTVAGDTVTQINANTLEWNPKLPTSISTGSASVELEFDVNVTYMSGQTSYTGTFELVESLNNAGASYNVTIIDRPEPVQTETPEPVQEVADEEIENVGSNVTRLTAMKNEVIYLTPQFTAEEIANSPVITNQLIPHYGEHFFIIATYNNPDFAGNLTKISQTNIYESDLDSDGNWTTGVYSNTVSQKTIKILTGNTHDTATPIRELEIEIYPDSTPSLTIFKPTDEEMHRIGDHHTYTVQSYLKKVTNETYMKTGGNHFRIGVFNNPIEENRTIIPYIDSEGIPQEVVVDSTNYESLSVQDIFTHAEYWSPPMTKLNEYEPVEVQFMYDQEFPVYILITGEFSEENTNNQVIYTEPCIVETAVYQGWERNGLFPEPIDNLISEDNETSEIILEPNGQSNTFTLAEFPLDDDFGTSENMAIRGIEVTGSIEASDELVMYGKLKAPSGETGQRTIILEEEDTNSVTDFSIGGVGDLWGFNLLDMQELEKWEIELTVNNSLNETQSHLNFGDIQVHIYTETVDSQNVTCKVNDENLAFYGLFLTNLVIPPGLNTDVDFLTIDGTDTNDAYRQNIREKTIELEFEIGDSCDLELNTNSLRQLTRLLTNTKDRYNRPIPKRIEFSHMPDVYYEYILKESINVEVDINTYVAKVKLIVPSGTAYSKKSTTTNVIGYVQGLASVSPVITVKPTDELVEVRETNTGQKFNIGYSGQWTDKIIEIDCENRIVWLKQNEEDTDPVNLNEYVDWNSDWFSLNGEYNFEGTNCVIRTVDYIERW